VTLRNMSRHCTMKEWIDQVTIKGLYNTNNTYEYD
jgi:hypothetical protein